MEAAFQNLLLELSTFCSPGGGKVFKMIFTSERSAWVQDPAETVFGRRALL